MAYSAITAGEIDADSPLTTSLVTKLRDNPEAIAGGLAGAPKVQYAGMNFSNNIVAGDIAADAVGASEIAANAVGASEIAANAVGTSEMADNAITEDTLAKPTAATTEIIKDIQSAELILSGAGSPIDFGTTFKCLVSGTYRVVFEHYSTGSVRSNIIYIKVNSITVSTKTAPDAQASYLAQTADIAMLAGDDLRLAMVLDQESPGYVRLAYVKSGIKVIGAE